MKTITTLLTTLFIVSFMKDTMGQHMIFYSNETDGYSLEFPEDWKRADEISGKLSLVALAPEETSAEDGVREQLHLSIFDLEGRNLAAFYDQFKISHQEANRSWKLAEDGEIMARDSKALYFQCYYSDLESGLTQGEFVYVFANAEQAYVLTCTTSFDQADTYKKVFNDIGRSFSFQLSPPE